MSLPDRVKHREPKRLRPRALPRGRPIIDSCNEVDCLRGVLTPALLQAAETRSRHLGVGAEQVLIRWGVIDEDAYLVRLAESLGTSIERFADTNRHDCVLSDADLAKAAQTGIIPLRRNDRLIWTITPRGFAARQLTRFAAAYPDLMPRLRLASARDHNRFLIQTTGHILTADAADGLRRRYPAMSAKTTTRPIQRSRGWIAAALGALATMVLWPAVTLQFANAMLAAWFLAFAVVRLAGSVVPRQYRGEVQRLRADELPIYSVIVALYREASSVAPLMDAINALDYPREKLDVIIVLEADDPQTRAAMMKIGPTPHVQLLIAPAIGPRTKPKALNVALPFARGSFVAVFDAEDAPEPGQLRAAIDAFRNHDADVACAQASLCIDNLTHSWLSRMFAAEYAGQFEVLLPGLVALGMPLPLGGSSNHFRTSVLREVSGWDAYNVTEDADLGFRLARFGYRSVTIGATTSEEAPTRLGAWLRQRSRWMKGWMQTWAVHMREPRRFRHEAGLRAFLALNIIVGGNILTALAFPVMAGEILLQLWDFTGTSMTDGLLAPLHLATIIAGCASTVILGLVGLSRQGRLRNGWILLLTPLYWGCLSIATWRALWQFWRNPYYWEKTEHGLAKRARFSQR